MDRIVVAFSHEEAQRRILRLLESAGCSPAACCVSGGETIRTVRKLGGAAVVCGFKLPDQTAQDLFQDLPASCAMLMVAVQGLLDLDQNEDIFRLAAPVSRGDLIASVRMLIQFGHRLERFVRPRRSTARFSQS